MEIERKVLCIYLCIKTHFMIRKLSSVLFAITIGIKAFAIPFSNLGDGNPINGTYLVESFDYKDAKNPQKDFLLSRGDFSNLVKFHSTFEFKSDGSVVQLMGDYKQEFVSELSNGKIRLYTCGNMNAKDLCIDLGKKSNDFSEYQMEWKGDKLILSQTNSTFILKLYLIKVK